MPTQTAIRAMVDKVGGIPVAERERIYQKYFSAPNNTVKFLNRYYGFDKKSILDVACHYGYYLVHFGEGSVGIDGSPHYLQFAREMGLAVQVTNIEEPLPDFGKTFDGLIFSGTFRGNPVSTFDVNALSSTIETKRAIVYPCTERATSVV